MATIVSIIVKAAFDPWRRRVSLRLCVEMSYEGCRGVGQTRSWQAIDAARKAPLLTVDVGGPLCVDAALSALDWTPTPLADAIRETVAWYETAEHRTYTRALAEGRTPTALAEPEQKRRRMNITLCFLFLFLFLLRSR